MNTHRNIPGMTRLMTIYNKGDFIGSSRKKKLVGFPGKIEKVETQASGNVKVTLVRENDSKKTSMIAILKRVEINNYSLDQYLEKDRPMNVFGISAKSHAIFPVCFLEISSDGSQHRIEIKENSGSYQYVLAQPGHGSQKVLDEWK
ncbi:hypothetical protein GF325_13175 [Candidatus Bathyarchaeota archaeon]|nr:hypothetical protein [Candidatus Bathyarchaeota archaeon]